VAVHSPGDPLDLCVRCPPPGATLLSMRTRSSEGLLLLNRCTCGTRSVVRLQRELVGVLPRTPTIDRP
jgi:hypothetical protein